MSTEQSHQSDFVRHHTDHGAVVGILNGTFRYSAIEYLNDSAERKWLYNYIDLSLDREKERHKEDRHMIEFLEIMRGYNATYSSLKSPTYYVGCFTNSDNELSHWRGYSRTVPSYAISFRRESLVKATRRLIECLEIGGVQAKNVTYLGPKKGGPLVDPFIREKIESMTRLIERKAQAERDGTPPPNVGCESTNIADALPLDMFRQHRDFFFKHEAFGEEAEFRIAVNLYKLPPTEGDVKFGVMAGAAFMKPYIELRYGKEVMKSMIDQMIVGPTPEPDLACEALRQYRTSLGYDFPVKYCDLPFRPGW